MGLEGYMNIIITIVLGIIIPATGFVVTLHIKVTILITRMDNHIKKQDTIIEKLMSKI